MIIRQNPRTASDTRSAQRPITYANPAPNEHVCVVCNIDISDLRRDAQRCKPCAKDRKKELAKLDYLKNSDKIKKRASDYYRQNRETVLRNGKSYRSTPEYKRRRQEWVQENPDLQREYRCRQKQRYREKSGYNPEGRTCQDCGADISDRGHNAKRCRPCATPPARTCKACHADISQRGARAEYCNDVCKHSYWQSKEAEGYTKTCTQCKETKQHTEFGWHNGLRRSTCKSCEVKVQSERFRNFTPEQIIRRNRRKRELAQIKRANQTPEEKDEERAKLLRAHRRNRYGPEFDENKLYSEQDGKCAICGAARPLDELELDHDHMTMKLRGFLCKNCNLKLLPRYERFPLERQDSDYLNAYLLVGKR